VLCNETSGWQLWQHDPNRLIEGVEMPQQVRGVIAKAKGEPVSIETIVIPDPGPGEVVVAIAACGVCHTDLHYREGGINDEFPFLLGHEAAGTVESVGDGVTNVAPGDYVILNWRAVCGECRSCRKGRPNICFNTHNATQKMTLLDGTELSPALGIGAFCEKTLVAAGQATKIDPSAPATAAGLLGCRLIAVCRDRRPRRTLGPPGDRRGQVEVGRGGASPGQDEGAQRLQLGVVPIAIGFELVDPGAAYPQGLIGIARTQRSGEVGADVEEVVLDAQQGGAHIVADVAGSQRDADGRIGLIGVGIRGQAHIGLRRPAEIPERRRALIAGAGVDPGEVDHDCQPARSPAVSGGETGL